MFKTANLRTAVAAFTLSALLALGAISEITHAAQHESQFEISAFTDSTDDSQWG
ncbi:MULTISPECIES: hypothetical protein [Streptomyces]|uniref:Secreted protein n=1 Tax=Streptomyces hyderabadensis TaxID=598549 RepID=A0ABP9ISV2_9ACTN|nr:hypothetical protein [Streptomyces hyderabadensis]